ncbi:MAG: hypothetical protein BGO49_14590 [Planctomycetales bacterium 71-10]|nr:MAG: hypothetical protein BGO49_14590 [Planctomycetales bacterium 71-10]
MATDRMNDLRAFKGFIEGRLAGAGDAPTLDEALIDWQLANQDDVELQGAVEAIREGLADAEAGRLIPARDAIDEVRRKHGLPPLP